MRDENGITWNCQVRNDDFFFLNEYDRFIEGSLAKENKKEKNNNKNNKKKLLAVQRERVDGYLLLLPRIHIYP